MKCPDTTFRVIVGLVVLVTTSLASERPNIILMMADDLGWGDPSYNDGWIDTPALDAMAAEGLRFDRFYSASAVCSPTRASCLTGRNPIRVGVPNANSGRLGADETPLSELLDGIGYATGHFGKWHLGTLTTLRKDSNRGASGNTSVYSPPWQHGYDHCFATEAKVPTFHPMRRAVNGLPEPLDFVDQNFYGTHYWTPPTDLSAAEGTPVDVTENLSGDDSRVIMDRVIPFVRAAVAADTPFFTVVWFHTPHKPLPDPDGTSSVDSAVAYTKAIVDMDTEIARLRAELDTLGVTGNTMFWFCSDNGPENGVGRSGPYRERKRSLHEGGVRVPGILVWPDKITTGRVTDFPAVTSDYYPTIVDYLCIDVPDQKPIDGASLRGVVENTATERAEPIGFQYINSQSWVSHQYKLISKNNGFTFELYDLIADERERSNIAADNPGIVAKMKNELETWLEAIRTDTEFLPPGDSPTVVLSTISATADELMVRISFDKDVTGLDLTDFLITNGVATDLSGDGASFTLTVRPEADGVLKVELPRDKAQDADSNPNLPSNTLAVWLGTPTSHLRDNVIIDDHFDDGLTDAWIGQGNTQAASHRITETDSILVSEVAASQTNTNRGIASKASIDPLAKNGFTLTFVVDNIAQRPAANGFFVGIVGDNSVFYRDGETRNFGLTFYGTEARTNSGSGFGLNYGDNFASAGAELRLTDADADLASFQDGFSATIRAAPLGWSYEITGLSGAEGTPTLFGSAGEWSDNGTTFEELFGIDESWHVVTSNQIVAAESHLTSFDRIRLTVGAEQPPTDLKVTIAEPVSEIVVRWASVEGRIYQIERSRDLATWDNLVTVTATERTSVYTDSDPVLPTQFYRVRIFQVSR